MQIYLYIFAGESVLEMKLKIRYSKIVYPIMFGMEQNTRRSTLFDYRKLQI